MEPPPFKELTWLRSVPSYTSDGTGVESVERALPDDVRERLRSMVAEHMKVITERLLDGMWGKPAIPFEQSVWPPKPVPHCPCGKCRGIFVCCIT